jgi:hypothetical protein
VLGNSHARFLGGWTRVTASDYPTARCALSLWVAKIICSWVPMPVESEPLQFTAW